MIKDQHTARTFSIKIYLIKKNNIYKLNAYWSNKLFNCLLTSSCFKQELEACGI